MSKAFVPLIIVLSVLLVLTLQFGFIFLLVALLPSVMAYFVDDHEGKPIFKTVLACNATGTLPPLMPMLMSGMQFHYHDVTAAMLAPHVWLFIYGGAAAGWGLIYLCRFIAHFILVIIYEYRIVSLERFQRKLIDEWGAEVMGASAQKN